MSSTTTRLDAATQLKRRLANPYASTLGERVHLPGEPGYDAARLAWNLAADLRPAAVARPHSAEEVALVVGAALDAGLRVAPQCTGHGAGPLAQQDLGDVVLVKLDELTGVTVDPITMRARVLGGTLWRDVVAEAEPYGLTAAHGSAGDVAVAGFMLGGGVSFYGRKHGISANGVRSIELVTAAGRLVRASATENPELFWAARGAGGNVGVVVALEIDLLPYATVYAGALLWPADDAPRVVRAWRDWTATAPDSVTTSLRILSFPPLPELPPFLSGRRVVLVDGAVLGPDGAAEEVLAPLRSLSPELDLFDRMPVGALLGVHLDPPQPTPSVADHAILGPLDDAGVDAFVAVAEETGVFCAELRQLGGRLAEPDPDGGVVSHIAGSYALLALAMAPTPELVTAGLSATTSVCERMAPWALPTALPTFAERPMTGSGLGSGEESDRLRRAVQDADPRQVLVANHPIR